VTAPVLSVHNVGKAYPTYRSSFHRVARWFGAPIQPAINRWAARGVSFEVRPGEAVGLIGQNGAGKSTALKLITGTVRPTEGTIGVNGRVSAILELGLGFNPDFTGRENVRNAGGLLGYSASQIEALTPGIEAFAELGDFFDQPLRVYSSGMQARLAFSLATASRPDLLIVDEVLSVGDTYFQHKSFDRIREFKEQGCAIILVSHGMADVRELCERVILMERGSVLRDGLPDEVIDYYNALIAEKESVNLSIQQKRRRDGWLESRSGSGEVAVSSIKLMDAETEHEVGVVRVGQQVKLRLEAKTTADVPRLVLGLMLRDRTGHIVWGTNTWHTEQVVTAIDGGSTIQFDISLKCDLGPGSYSISPALVSSATHLENNYEWIDNALVFEVQNPNLPFFLGTSYLEAKFTIDRK